MIRTTLCLLPIALVLAGCGDSDPARVEVPAPPPEPLDITNDTAQTYVKLVLAVEAHDPGYVDAYYGPPEWKQEVEDHPLSLDEIRGEAEILRSELSELPTPEDELEALRLEYLDKQLSAVIARVEMLGGTTLSFDEEAQALYDAAPPHDSEDHFQAVLDELDDLLPGRGPLADRYNAMRDRVVIPPERLDAVFAAAIDGCRQRTEAHIELPAEEAFRLEYVTDKSWSGYNWFQGGYQSLIQINTDLPIYIDRAVDLACHEGYPGHHVYNLLLEKHLVVDRGWMEFSVYPLFSPQSLIAEGTANFGKEMAFPGDERLAFERDVLFPLAGLDPELAGLYDQAQELMDRLDYAGNEAARRYLNGEIDRAEAEAWLVRYQLSTPERAAQRVRFMDTYRAYVINYNLGEDLVRAYVDREAGDDPARRWEVFGALLSSPRLPSGLAAAGG